MEISKNQHLFCNNLITNWYEAYQNIDTKENSDIYIYINVHTWSTWKENYQKKLNIIDGDWSIL